MFRKMKVFKTLLIGVLLIAALAACSSAAVQADAPAAASTAVSTASSSTSPAVEATADDAGLPSTGQGTEAAQLSPAKLNLNTATEVDFLTIPGMGNRMVREFMEYRPYVSIEQFRREIGKYVDDSQVAAYEQYVYVPVSVNEADAATLLQLPGLDESEAQALIDARPYASNDAFLTALAGYVSTDELALAQTYLTTP
jgi:DNA uptake protein ComE-like DNA-binding protein